MKQNNITDPEHDNMQLLLYCQLIYSNLEESRRQYFSNKKYYQGNQWHEIVYDEATKKHITEEEIIRRQGRIPFVQNIIYQLTNNILGQFRANPTQTTVIARLRDKQLAGEMLTNAIQSINSLNNIDEVDSNALLCYLLSGLSICKTTYEYFPEYNKNDFLLKYIPISKIFFNANISDVRIERNLDTIGEIIDTPLDNIISAFAKTKEDADKITDIYGQYRKDKYRTIPSSRLDDDTVNNLDFYIPNDMSLCRFYEIWQKKGKWKLQYHDYAEGKFGFTNLTKKQLQSENENRIAVGRANGISEEQIPLITFEEKYETVWYVKYLTPTGYCLFESESPYAHEEHPYNIVIKGVDSKPTSLISIIKPQQRFINRLINLLDQQIGYSAKNVVMIPAGSLNGITTQQFAEEMTKPNAVIEWTPDPQNPNNKPFIMSTNSTDVGARQLLETQLNMINSISGVNSALQGQVVASGTPASLYAQMAQNSSTNLNDILSTFNNLIEKRNKKLLKLILQYYDERRQLSSLGINKESDVYDPEVVANLDYELVITESQDTPVYRNLNDQLLMTLYQSQAIDPKTLVRNISLPGADKLLQDMEMQEQEQKEQQQQMMQQQQAQQMQQIKNGMPPQEHR
ncbi:hypothetical protein FACS1894153_2580 [Bacteroidia bacterium]|nr:hypothetical protein FACS1894153_2580 [Bacteroidia bacterium]